MIQRMIYEFTLLADMVERIDIFCNENMLYSGPSPDPMDTNWGGSEYTEKLVDKGYYADNEVKLRV